MKLKYKLLALFIFPGLMASNMFHEYYVSMTRVEYVKEEKAIQIISQIFIDDFENLLRQRYDENIVLGEQNEDSMIEAYVERYLNTKLIFVVNGKALEFDFIGKEYKDDIVYCYLEIKNISEIKSMEITNTILFDVFEDQQNIVRTKINGKNKSFILIPAKNKGVLNFD